MADISQGPVSTLPGHTQQVEPQVMCDQHNDRPAVRRVQGETDSFGCEYHDLCQECIDEMRAAIEADRVGVCDWCLKDAKDLRDRRDIDEGMCGRVYRVCGECVNVENARLAAEMNESGYYDRWDFED
jgi:hypothetical protein